MASIRRPASKARTIRAAAPPWPATPPTDTEGTDLKSVPQPDQLVLGGTGDDILTGGSGSDLLVGGDDNDILVGGIGNDVLSGGQGADTFAFNAGETGSGNVDTIVDYNAAEGDKLDLSALLDIALGKNVTDYKSHFRQSPIWQRNEAQ